MSLRGNCHTFHLFCEISECGNFARFVATDDVFFVFIFLKWRNHIIRNVSTGKINYAGSIASFSFFPPRTFFEELELCGHTELHSIKIDDNSSLTLDSEKTGSGCCCYDTTAELLSSDVAPTTPGNISRDVSRHTAWEEPFSKSLAPWFLVESLLKITTI